MTCPKLTVIKTTHRPTVIKYRRETAGEIAERLRKGIDPVPMFTSEAREGPNENIWLSSV